jgi:hypothetical protein
LAPVFNGHVRERNQHLRSQLRHSISL